MRFLIACLLLLALALPACADSPVPPALENVHRIVCLGDSITQGGEGPGGYVWLFRHYLNALYPQQNIEIAYLLNLRYYVEATAAK
ncbi:MAG TPA: hypothetical protein VKU00_08415 [Chthonomonadaceae bacterium]|nr:hypothetical protein [Chthonomonadaceae bacterium]